MIDDKLMNEFEKLYQNQEMMAKQTASELYSSLSNTETHCINYIGDNLEANGVELATNLKLTRSTISKMTTRLEKRGYIVGVKKADNKKEIFYSLTDSGREIYLKHEEAHSAWLKRDMDFLLTVDDSEKEIVLKVISDFNIYLRNQMEVFKNDN